MKNKNNTFARRIASKFIDSSNSGKIFLKESDNIIKLGIITMTTLFIFIDIIYALNHGIMASIITLLVSLIPYSVGLFVLRKIVPIYAKFIYRKKIERYLKKCLAQNMDRIIISVYKFRLFTFSKADNNIFSTTMYATRVIQIENVFIEIYRPSFSKGGTSLVMNIVDPTDNPSHLEDILNSFKKRTIQIEYLP